MKYLVHSMNGIGDFLWILPRMQAIRKADPEAYIVIYTNGNATKALYELRMEMMPLQDAIDKLVYFNVRKPFQTLKCWLWIGFKRFDYSLVANLGMTGGKVSAAVAIAGAKTSVGVEMPHLPHMRFTKTIKREANQLSKRYYYGKMLRAIGIEPPKEGEICIPNEKLQPYLKSAGLIHLKCDDYIGIAVGTAQASFRTGMKWNYNNVKTWLLERWLMLAEKLLQNGYKVILLGGKREKEEMERQNVNLPDGAIDIIGKTSVPESIAVVSACKLLISGDTGLMHAAYDVGTPVLSLFGCTDPHYIFPYGGKNQVICTEEPCAPCWGTRRVIECKDNKCMKKITVQMVYDKAVEMMEDLTGQTSQRR